MYGCWPLHFHIVGILKQIYMSNVVNGSSKSHQTNHYTINHWELKSSGLAPPNPFQFFSGVETADMCLLCVQLGLNRAKQSVWTKLEEVWKTTSIFLKMEHVWKTTSIFLKMEDDLIFWKRRQPQFYLKMEDDLKKIMPPKQLKVKTIIFLKMSDDLNF